MPRMYDSWVFTTVCLQETKQDAQILTAKLLTTHTEFDKRTDATKLTGHESTKDYSRLD